MAAVRLDDAAAGALGENHGGVQVKTARPRKATHGTKSHLEAIVLSDLNAFGLSGGMKTQFRFHPVRKWLMDFAWPLRKLALEVNGGTYMGGAHSRGAGQRKDFEKWSEAGLLGWRVLHVDTVDVKHKVHVERVQRALEG